MIDHCQLLLDVWRELFRTLDLRQATNMVVGLISERLPLSALLVREFAEMSHSLETVAIASPKNQHVYAPSQFSATPTKWKRIHAWAESDDTAHCSSENRMSLRDLLVPAELPGEVIAVPLTNHQGPIGGLMLVAEHMRSFKPLHVEFANSLRDPFSAALDRHCRQRELRALRKAAESDPRATLIRLGRTENDEAVVGSETGLKHVMERVELVAQSDVPVLILGETGTGKEVVARAIHTRSKRSGGPFIRVNCGAIPSELIDSQLFGHEKGSFTGASDQRMGWFERADGGTLFLDEIGELPLQAQVRLLRVLQDHQIERVGGQQLIHVDVRIVAATHRDLASMVKSASFREDLWYRVNVFPILLPRLSERVGDIPALARHFANRAANRFGLAYVEPAPSDLHTLMNYPWPGNIRELAAVIDRAVILGNGETFDVRKALGLGQPLTYTSPVSDNEPTFYEVVPESRPIAIQSSGEPTNLHTLDTAIKQHIERALAATQGQVEGKRGAASLLGINPHTLRAKMRKLKIDWARFR